MTSIAGGPAPVAQVTFTPAQSAGDDTRLEARAAAVAASARKADDEAPRRQSVDGPNNAVSSKEVAAHYDRHGKSAHAESRYKERENKVDIKA